MNFVVDFNNNLVKRMFFYRSFSEETFNLKKFNSKKKIIDKINLEGSFKVKKVIKKKDILKKNIILRILTNNSSEIVSVNKKKIFKENTITNVLNEINQKKIESFISDWFFLFNPFFQENEMVSINGPKSYKKNFDAFKTLRILNSKIFTSSFFNFELSLKIFFHEDKGLSEIFIKNYEC